MNKKFQGQIIQGPGGSLLTIQDVHYSGSGYQIYQTSESNLVVKIYDTDKKYTQTEKNVYKLLKAHPNIGIMKGGEIKSLPVTLMEKGMFFEKILQKLTQGLNEPQVLKIIRDLSKAVAYSFSQGVVHRDIRIENIIFGTDGKFKLQNFQKATFQMYTKVPNEIKTQIKEEIEANVHASIRAPEQSDLNLGFALNEKVDIYSIGCLIYHLIYNVRYNPLQPTFNNNTEWQVYSEKLCYLVKTLVAQNPKDRPSALQIEQYIETFSINGSISSQSNSQVYTQQQHSQDNEQISNNQMNQDMAPQNSGHIHVRSKSSNSSIAMNSTEGKKGTEAELKDKFQGLDCAEVKGQDNKSSFYIQMIKYISRFSNKTEGWVLACVEDIDEGPKQKYVRYLIVKAWNKKEKIPKFYSTLNQKIVKVHIDNTIIMLKTTILLHNYFKKGPLEVMTFAQKECSPQDILKKIIIQWKTIHEGLLNQKLSLNKSDKEKDKSRSIYTSLLLVDYSSLMLEKLRVCVFYNSYFEGNYSFNPFFNSMLKTFKPLTFGLLENILRFWDKCIVFAQTLFKENNLVRIQFSLGLSMIDEIYCIVSLICHLIFAFKHSTNYIEGSQINEQGLREKILQLEDAFTRSYTLTVSYFNQCRTSQLFQSISNMVPNLPLTLLDTIKSVPLLQQTKGDFNIFDYLNYGKSLDGVKLPLSYGEAIANIKIENEEMISLNMNEEKFHTVNYSNFHEDTKVAQVGYNEGFSQTVRENRFQHSHKGSDTLDTIKKPHPQSAKQSFPFPEPSFSKNDFEKIANKQPKQANPFEQFNVYNEFSHQTYSQDFNVNAQLSLKEQQEKQKNLQLFDYEQNIKKEPVVVVINQKENLKQEKQIKIKEPEIVQQAVSQKYVPLQQLIDSPQLKDSKKDVKKTGKPVKKVTEGYQDLSFSEDDIEDGPDLNQTKPIQALEFSNQKATITRAMVEKEDFLAMPSVGQRGVSPNQQSGNAIKKALSQSIPQTSNFVVDFSNIQQPNQDPRQSWLNAQNSGNTQQNVFAQFNPSFVQQNSGPKQQQQSNDLEKPSPPQQQTNRSSQIVYHQQQQQQPIIAPQQQQPRPSLQNNYNQNSQVAPQQNNYYNVQQPQQVTQTQQIVQQQNPQQSQRLPSANPIQNYYLPQQQNQQYNYQPPQAYQPPYQQPLQQRPQAQSTQAFELYKFITQELKTNASDWIINLNQLTIEKQIGTGSSCDVFKGYWRGNEVAVKKMKIKSISENHMKEFRREITALVKIKPHKNLVSLIGISQKDDELYIVTEFCAGGTLFDLLHRKKNMGIPWVIRIRMCYQVAQGISYLHDLVPPIIHRDLKSLNLLLENAFDQTSLQKINVKIADFGLARAQVENGEQMTGVLGTFHWMAPEIFESKPYTIKADVYSFGVIINRKLIKKIVLWEICSRETPYKSFSTPHAIMKFVTFDKGRPDLNSIQDGCPITLRDLIIRCWDHEPSARPAFQEIVSILRSIL